MQNIATGSEQTFQPKAQPRSPDDGRRYPSAGSGAARHSKTGFDSDKRNARGYSCSSFLSGSGNARYLGFDYGFLARQASKTPCGRVALPPGIGVPNGTRELAFSSQSSAGNNSKAAVALLANNRLASARAQPSRGAL